MKERKFIDTVSNLTIYIDKIDSNNKYTNIILKDEITDNKSQIIYAKKGELIKENENFYLILNDGEIINLNNDRIDKFNFEKTVFNISKFSTKTTTYPKIQERRTTTLLKCLRYLNNIIIYPESFMDMNCDDKSEKPIIRELFKRVISPIYIPIIALLVSILILQDRHQINYKFFKIKIFIITLFALFASELSMRFIGISDNINYITSLFPFFILFSIYIFIKKKLN
jgi:lipopolysaccharide export system permease protein